MTSAGRRAGLGLCSLRVRAPPLGLGLRLRVWSPPLPTLSPGQSVLGQQSRVRVFSGPPLGLRSGSEPRPSGGAAPPPQPPSSSKGTGSIRQECPPCWARQLGDQLSSPQSCLTGPRLPPLLLGLTSAAGLRAWPLISSAVSSGAGKEVGAGAGSSCCWGSRAPMALSCHKPGDQEGGPGAGPPEGLLWEQVCGTGVLDAGAPGPGPALWGAVSAVQALAQAWTLCLSTLLPRSSLHPTTSPLRR